MKDRLASLGSWPPCNSTEHTWVSRREDGHLKVGRKAAAVRLPRPVMQPKPAKDGTEPRSTDAAIYAKVCFVVGLLKSIGPHQTVLAADLTVQKLDCRL